MDVKGKHNFEQRPQVNTVPVLTEGSAEISALTEKTTPVSADLLLIEDSAASYAKKKLQIGNIAQIFGSQYQSATSEGESSTTSATYVQKLRLTTASVPAGNYYIGWFFEHAMSGDDKQFGYRLQVDDTTTFAEGILENKGQYSDSQWRPKSGFYVATLTAATHTVDIDYLAVSDTAYIRRARIVVWRVS